MNTFSSDVINQEVTVNAFYFAGDSLKTFPRQIELDGGEAITFAGGLRYLIRQGQQLVRLFDMSASDGQLTYRLRQDGNLWTLVGTKAVA